MATASTSEFATAERGRRLGVVHLSVATGLTAGLIMVLCWLGTFVAFSSPTHAYIGLFTNADMGSVRALVEGTCWSLLFGLIVGAVFALVYNATASFDRN